jgi:hypothetical protein
MAPTLSTKHVAAGSSAAKAAVPPPAAAAASRGPSPKQMALAVSATALLGAAPALAAEVPAPAPVTHQMQHISSSTAVKFSSVKAPQGEALLALWVLHCEVLKARAMRIALHGKQLTGAYARTLDFPVEQLGVAVGSIFEGAFKLSGWLCCRPTPLCLTHLLSLGQCLTTPAISHPAHPTQCAPLMMA